MTGASDCQLEAQLQWQPAQTSVAYMLQYKQLNRMSSPTGSPQSVQTSTSPSSSALLFKVCGLDCCCVSAVVAAVLFLGEEFYLINGMGLAVLVMGVFWFNYTKYKKVAAGEIKPSKSANLEPWKEEDTPDVVSSITGRSSQYS